MRDGRADFAARDQHLGEGSGRHRERPDGADGLGGPKRLRGEADGVVEPSEIGQSSCASMLSGRVVRAVIVSSAMFAAGCSTPFHLSDGHVTSTPRPPSIDMAVLACEPVAALGVVAPSGIQGLSPTVSHALTIALAQGSPPIRVVPMPEVLNRLTDRGLAGEYAEISAGYGRSGIPERERLQRIGAALDSRYLLQPGLAEFSQSLVDKFEFTGLKIVKTRISVLRLWLQVWDTKTGHILSESTGELTVAAQVLRQDRTVSLDEITQKLWSRIIRDGLLAGSTGSPPCP